MKTSKLFSWFFLSTGIFAIVGALYTWGVGPIYQQRDLLAVLVPWADLMISGPLSLLTAFGLWRMRSWGYLLGMMVCGIYLFGSTLVYITLIWNGTPYPPELVYPPILGVCFSIAFPIWVLNNSQVFNLPQAFQHGVKTEEITPSGWETGDHALSPEPDLAGNV